MSKQKNNDMMKPDKWKRRYWTESEQEEPLETDGAE